MAINLKFLGVTLWVISGPIPVLAQHLSAPVTYRGMCDASAAVSLSSNLFIVANDEDNLLRIYHRHPGDLPASTFDLTSFLKIGNKSPESDIEACAQVGDRIYWITSHGRNARGKNSPNRERFFATTWSISNQQTVLKPLGRPYPHLLEDLSQAPQLRRFQLKGASRLAPKSPGALNIEGMTATPDGTLLIGFRNPIPAGNGLLVPLLNPAEVIEGHRAQFGPPILLDLGGYGIRSLAFDGLNYLIIAGSYSTEGSSRAYEWDGSSPNPRWIRGLQFPGLNPEGLAFSRDQQRRDFFVLSDDGTLQIGGMDCKWLADPADRQFRGYQVRLDED